MFRKIPKSKVALEKAARLSPLELDVLDMHVTAAFLRPDSYLEIADQFHTVQDEVVFEHVAVQLDVVLLVLVVAPNGRIGMTGLHPVSLTAA